ncbi:MAG: PhoH family protein [Candidatus Nanopelagicales bacterium]|jgi:phosphate starvation-inducible PhoH-like protein
MSNIDIKNESKVTIPSSINLTALFGTHDENLRKIEELFPECKILLRGNEISFFADQINSGYLNQLFTELVSIIRTGQVVQPELVERVIALIKSESKVSAKDMLTTNILTTRGKSIRAKTFNQKKYVDAIDNHTIVFGIGPAGSGKTYLAVAKAVQALQEKQVNRIILTRPAVEAGEKLGFLPGTLSEKIDPYLRPLYDALQDMIEPEKIPKLMTNGSIEVAPLAYMRGRTLNDSFIILDEAQNTSAEQMKMFLTRLGFGSKIVVTGDVTQIDLPSGTRSGLKIVREVLETVEDLAFINLTSQDVVRHKLVGKIVEAYDQWDAAKQEVSQK